MSREMQDASGRTVASLERTLHTYRRAWEDEKAKVAARDAEWRAAVNGLSRKHDSTCDLKRGEPCDCGAGAHNQTLLALLAAMEGK